MTKGLGRATFGRLGARCEGKEISDEDGGGCLSSQGETRCPIGVFLIPRRSFKERNGCDEHEERGVEVRGACEAGSWDCGEP